MDLSKYKTDTVHIVYDRKEAYQVLEKVLNYLHYLNPVYFYIYFNDNSPVKWSSYEKIYSELKNRSGFIKLRSEDTHNAKMIGEIVSEYHEAFLYVCQQPDLVELYGQESPPIITEIKGGGYNLSFWDTDLNIYKTSNIKPWNLLELAINLDNIFIRRQDNKEISITYIIDNKRESREILDIINSFFTENNIVPITQNNYFDIIDIEYLSNLTINSNLDTGIRPKMVIDGYNVSFYIFSVVHIITIENCMDNLNILKEWIKLFFFSKIRLVYRGKDCMSVSFLDRNETIKKEINLLHNVMDRVLSNLKRKEIFEYEPIITNNLS